MEIKKESFLTEIKKKYQKKKIGLCHGVFDILHNGHIEHFKKAKKNVDILVVSITSKKFVNKGPRQPLNDDQKRLNLIDSIKYIDYVYINNAKDASGVLSNLKPNYYFKGQDYLKADNHGNLKKELRILKKNKGKIFYTKTKLESSTKLFNKNYGWSDTQIKQLKNISKISIEEIKSYFDNISKITLNLIGEPIIDKYEIGKIMGVTTKDPAISILSHKIDCIGGGVIAIAKMASEFVKEVNLYTYGNHLEIKKNFSNYPNVKIFNFSKNKEIQYKTRFINSNREEKLLQVTNFDKNHFSKNEIKRLKIRINKLKEKNLVICDFGVGLFENEFLKFLNKKKIKKYLNIQSNSINLGFNLFTKYNSAHYVSLDSREWSLGIGNKKLDYKFLKMRTKNFNSISVTLGKEGAKFLIGKENNFSPSFVKTIKDTTGSGDAYFIMSSLLIMVKAKHNIVPFLGNLYAGMHGQNLGNKNIITKNELLKNIISIINI